MEIYALCQVANGIQKQSGDTYNECYNDLIEMIVSDVKKDIQMENTGREVSA